MGLEMSVIAKAACQTVENNNNKKTPSLLIALSATEATCTGFVKSKHTVPVLKNKQTKKKHFADI